MIEEIVRDTLEEQLHVKAYMDLPEDLPDTFVFVDKTGETMRNFISTATFAIRSYAPSTMEAGRLSEKVRGVMDTLLERDDIASVRLNSEADYPDTERKRPRYQAAFDIVYYDG